MQFVEDLIDRRDHEARVKDRRTQRKTRQVMRNRVYEAERATEQAHRRSIRDAKHVSYFD